MTDNRRFSNFNRLKINANSVLFNKPASRANLNSHKSEVSKVSEVSEAMEIGVLEEENIVDKIVTKNNNFMVKQITTQTQPFTNKLSYSVLIAPPSSGTGKKKRKSLLFLKKSALRSFNSEDLDKKLKIYETYNKRIKWIDIIIMIINLITIYTFYFEHFDYINNNYTLDETSNLIRVVLLISSLFVCGVIILRFIYRNRLEKILCELGDKLAEDFSSIKLLITELILHIAQPFPNMHCEFVIEVLGQKVTYTLNLLLYFFCIFRVYVLFQVIRYLNLYSQKRSRKILRFFSPFTNSTIFLYKANLDSRGFLTLTFVGFFTLVVSSLLLKAMEYTKEDSSNLFYYYWNSLWYLVVTMCTIGFNDITPYTVLGRFVGVIVCLVGVVILSLLVVTLTFFTDLETDELAAYNDINNLSASYNQRKGAREYIENLIKYKIKNKRKKIDLDCIIDKIQRNRNRTEIIMHLKRKLAKKGIFDEFINKIRDITESKFGALTSGFQGMWGVEDHLDEYVETSEYLTNSVRKNKTLMISCLNLAKCLVKVGSIGNLERIDDIQGRKLISDHMMLKAKRNYYNTIEDYPDCSYCSSPLDANSVDMENNAQNNSVRDSYSELYSDTDSSNRNTD